MLTNVSTALMDVVRVKMAQGTALNPWLFPCLPKIYDHYDLQPTVTVHSRPGMRELRR